MKSKSFAQQLVEDRRLCMLRVLSEQPGRTANSSVLHMGVVHLRHVCSRADAINDLRVLELHQLVTLEQLTDTVYGAELTGHGEDFLRGHFDIDGVSRPRRGI